MSPMAKRQNESYHQSLIDFAHFALSVDRKHATIYRDSERGQTPHEVNGRVPDLFFRDGEDLRVYEVETCDTIDDEHTEEQWTDFAEYANDQSASFVVILPADCKEKAEQRIEELGIPETGVWPASP